MRNQSVIMWFFLRFSHDGLIKKDLSGLYEVVIKVSEFVPHLNTLWVWAIKNILMVLTKAKHTISVK